MADLAQQITTNYKKQLRTDLIQPFCDYFGLRSSITAIANLQIMHDAGLEFGSVEEFMNYLTQTFRKDGKRR